MNNAVFTVKSFGRLVPAIKGQKAFVPHSLPPKLVWTGQLASVLSEADRSVGQLKGLGINLPNPHLLIQPFIRKEAQMSSQIEGTVATMAQLYLFEAGDRSVEQVPDVREVFNYVQAIEEGMQLNQQLPVCLRMIRQLHQTLMKDVRGENKRPGQFRKDQNWIGPVGCSIEQATYIPPPPDEMNRCLDEMEKFINKPVNELPVLVWLAMIHYQFEAIHPFNDGNGRIGRLLITLLMCAKEILDKPLLYFSAYFEKNRQEYYKRLLSVSTMGQWNEWILFFLKGIAEQSKDASEKAYQLMRLQQEYHQVVGKSRSALQIKLVDSLFEQPAIKPTQTAKQFGVTYTAAKNNIDRLVQAGILKEITTSKRNKIYIAKKILEIINR
jgi:Fic family protein